MFGSPVAFTVPDLDRTDYLVIIGANPLCPTEVCATAADFPGKLKALRKRGGRLVVIDPRRTRTAEARRPAPRPPARAPTRACCSPSCTCSSTRAWSTGPRRRSPTTSPASTTSRALAADFAPEAVAEHCGVAADDDPDAGPRARRRADAPPSTAASAPRTVEFGTLGSWLVDVVNVLTGNLDRPGGAMFPLGRRRRRHRVRRDRVAGSPPGAGTAGSRGYPEVLSANCPAAALAEEIETPGDGQVKAMITIAGNPVLSAPDGTGSTARSTALEFMVSVDPYLNETTRHADVILPPPPPSQSAHFDFALNNLAVRNNARYSPPVLPLARPARRGRDPVAAGADRVRRRRRRRSRARRRPGHRHDVGQGGRRPGLTGRRPRPLMSWPRCSRAAAATNGAST